MKPVVEYRMDDFNILEGDYYVVDVSDDKGKVIDTIKIEELSIAGFYEFVPLWQTYMIDILDIIKQCEIDLTILDNIQKDKYNVVMNSIQRLLSYVKVRHSFITLLKKLKLTKLNVKEFEKYIKLSQLASIFLTLYYFNTDGLKKKLLMTIQGVFSTKIRTLETSTTSYIDEDGSRQLKPRFRRLAI